jgi:hypothetical protein
MSLPTRRQGLALLAAGTLAPGCLLAAPERRYAVISLVGDEIVLVYATAVTGSHLDRNRHRVLPDAAGSFDKFALAATGKAIEGRDPQAKVSLLSVGPSPLHGNPEPLFDGQNIALPDALVAALEQAQATHVVLLTKFRNPASIALAHTHIGVGALRGLGYYVDRTTHLRMVESGATGQGLLAAYAYLRLSLADARTGAVLRQRLLSATRVYPVAAQESAIDPWELLTAQQKVERLRGLLERQLALEIPALIAPD